MYTFTRWSTSRKGHTAPCTIWNKVYTNRRHCLRCTHLWYRICISSPISNTPVLGQFRSNCVGFISVAVVRAATVSNAQAGALDAGEYGVKFVIVGLLWDDAVARWKYTWNIVCATQKCHRWLGGGQVEQWTQRVMIKLPTQVCLGHTRRSWKWSPGNHHNSKLCCLPVCYSMILNQFANKCFRDILCF